jgi:hypothetical protein
MRPLATTLVALLLALNTYAQAPQKMSYQTVLRNSSDMLIANTLVGMRIGIRQGSPTGTAVYVETHTPTTNSSGLVSLEIGTGTIVSGTFAGIDWENGPYFLETETDPDGGTSYSITGTSQLLSVPYALYAKASGGGRTYLVLTGDVTDAEAAQILQHEVGPQTQFIWIMNTTQLTTVDFPGISELVEVKIEKNSALSSVSFPDLTNVWSNLSAQNNAALTSLNVPALTNVNVDLRVLYNASLPILNLPSLTACGSFSAGGAGSAMTSVNAPLLATVSGSFSVGSSPALTTLDLPALTSSFAFYVGMNPSLTSVNTPLLTDVSGTFTVGQNASLTSLNIPSLATVSIGDGVYVTGNTSLTTLSVPALYHVFDTRFYVSGNAFSSSTVNGLLAELAAINPSISTWRIRLEGQIPPAPPTGQGILDKATLINNGNPIVETD